METAKHYQDQQQIQPRLFFVLKNFKQSDRVITTTNRKGEFKTFLR